MFEVTVHSIRVDDNTDERAVILRNQETLYYMPVWMNQVLSDAIIDGIVGTTYDRPTTHDVLASSYKVIQRMGGKVDHVLIDSVDDDGNYMARIMLDIKGSKGTVRSRPSDAIALAVRLNVPIMVSEEILQSTGTHESEVPFEV